MLWLGLTLVSDCDQGMWIESVSEQGAEDKIYIVGRRKNCWRKLYTEEIHGVYFNQTLLTSLNYGNADSQGT